jgi:hypothetical protein
MQWLPALLRRLGQVAVLALLPWSAAQAADEASLKAAIVYNLMLYVEWPPSVRASAGGPWVLCVPPTHPAAGAMRLLDGRPLREGLLQVTNRLPSGSSGPCHAALVSTADLRGEQADLPARGVLVISEDERGSHPAASIVLQRVDGRMAFRVDLRAARAAQLQLSSKLLRLAREIQE